MLAGLQQDLALEHEPEGRARPERVTARMGSQAVTEARHHPPVAHALEHRGAPDQADHIGHRIRRNGLFGKRTGEVGVRRAGRGSP